MENGNEVTTLKLRRLLHALKDSRPDICIRFRIIGQMWQMHYSKIIELNEHGGIFQNENAGSLYAIPDFNEIIQFEIDQRFQEYHPHFHYQLGPSLTISENQPASTPGANAEFIPQSVNPEQHPIPLSPTVL
jgi:hypothetical protein